MTISFHELQRIVDEHDDALPAGDWRRYGTPARLCRFNHAAAVAAAQAALDECRAEAAAAKAACHAVYEEDGRHRPGFDSKEAVRRHKRWQALDDKLRAMHRAHPAEGSIREHAARWINDPSEENRERLAIFVA
jgi:hypothetical protein